MKNSFRGGIIYFLPSIWVVLVASMSIYLRFSEGIFSFSSGDYRNFLLPWINQIIQLGGWPSLGVTIGNYTVPYVMVLTTISYLPFDYMAAIKSISIAFDVGMAFATFSLISRFYQNSVNGKRLGTAGALFVLLLPTVILNGAMWSQSDSIFTFFLLLSLIFIHQQKFGWSMVFYGIAFTLKLQAIFLLPFLGFLYLWNERFHLYHFLLIPSVYLVLSIPAFVMGRSFLDVVLIYVYQTQTYPYMTMNFPSLYALVPSQYEIFGNWAVVLYTAFILGVAVYGIRAKLKIPKNMIVDVALWVLVVTVYLLPSMHERYMYPADVLSLSYVAIRKKHWYVPIAINLLSLLSYYPYLFSTTVIEMPLLSLGFLIFLYFFTKDVYIDLTTALKNPTLELA